MTVAIYTALFGDYDLPPAQTGQDMDVAWYAFTDGPDFPPPWTTVRTVCDGHCPRMVAKRYKCVPHNSLTEPVSIWIDANTEIISPTFARDVLDSLHDDIALFRHPQRSCIYSEADASLRLAPEKYGHLPIRAQVAHYRSVGYPAHAGLYACGTLARNHTTRMAQFGWRWLGDCTRFTYQDQLSFPVICRELDIVPGVFDEPQIGARDHFGNRWQTIHPHNSNR